jgi:hypothetical protein
MHESQQPIPKRVIPVEHISIEECIAKLSRLIAKGLNFYPSFYFPRAVYTYLSALSYEERKEVYRKLGQKKIAAFKRAIEFDLCSYSPETEYIVTYQVTPTCSADQTEEAFPLAPVRQILKEL